MRIYIPEKAKDGSFGGGWSFTSNLIKALNKKVEFVDNWYKSDIYFIPGPTLAERDDIKDAKSKGKKIILRVDNLPRNSRNRNTGTSRLYDMAQMADAVIYQSQWARNLISPFIKKDGIVILNGVDTSIFKLAGEKMPKDGCPQCLFSRSSRDEIKRWEKAWYNFQELFFKNQKAHLWIVGKFSDENIKYNFDLFGGAEKRYKFFGTITKQEEMAKLYRSTDLLFLPFSFEACSNTFIEAKACGTTIIFDDRDGGGIIEQDKAGIITLEEMGNKYLEVFKNL